MSSHPLERETIGRSHLAISAAEAEERIRELVSAESDRPARKRGPVTAVQLIRSASPYDIGDWIVQTDGSRAYRLDLEVEDATAIGFILEISHAPPRAVTYSYAPEGDAPVTHRGPHLFVPRPDGKPMYVAPIKGERVVLEIHNLPPGYATDFSKAPPFTITAVVRTPALAGYLSLAEELGVIAEPRATCSPQRDVACDARTTGVERGVLGIETCGSAFCNYCSAALLKDFEPHTDIPYILTAGHCEIVDGLAVSLHFRYEATNCNGDGTNLFHEEIAPPLFRLDGEWTNEGDRSCNAPDWALLRFNLASELTHAPTFLQGTDAIPESFDTVFTVHHPKGERTRLSEGEIATLQTGHESTRSVTLDVFSDTEAGSDGAPWFDAGNDRIWAVHNCGGRCSITPSVTATRYDHISGRIGRFLKPRLARPQMTNVSRVGRIKLGDEIVLRVDAENTGAYTSDRGHITVSFPDLDQPSDASFVRYSAKSPDLAYIERSTGMAMDARDGSSPPMSYLHIEAAAPRWAPSESHFIELAIEPQKAGPFEILYRAAMRSENLYDYNDPADESADGMDLDQGWGVRRLVVQVDDPKNPACDEHSIQRIDFDGVQPVLNQASIPSACGDAHVQHKGAVPSAVLSLSSGSGSPGSTVELQMSLAGGAAPVGLQWTMNYSDMELGFEQSTAGPVITAANKSILCNSQTGMTTCIVFGGLDTIADGVVANVTFLIAPTTSTNPSAVTLSELSAASLGGNPIPTTGTGGTISIESCPTDLVLADQTISGVQVMQATNSVSLGPNLVINGGNIVVKAPTVTILAGTDIGGVFSIANNTSCP